VMRVLEGERRARAGVCVLVQDCPGVGRRSPVNAASVALRTTSARSRTSSAGVAGR
jgi:hypothetical protein